MRGVGEKRQARGAILTVLMPFSPARARVPRAPIHSRAEPAGRSSPRRPSQPVRSRTAARRVRSGAGERPSEADTRGGMATGQSQCRLPPLGDRAPCGCPRAAPVGPAYLHPPPDPVALSHWLEMRDPGPRPRRGAAELGCA